MVIKTHYCVHGILLGFFFALQRIFHDKFYLKWLPSERKIMYGMFQHHPLHWYFEQMTTINKGSSGWPGEQRETSTQTFQGDYRFKQLWIENIHTQNPISMEYVQIFSFSFPKGCNCLHIPFAWHWVSRQF